MALVNQAKREINAKIVLFGPGTAGKAATLKHVHSKLKPDFRGAMKVMNVQDARMLFFDFTPPGDGNVDGFRVRFHLYTVSGAEVDPAAWKMVLKGVDGILFVADSTPQRLDENRSGLEALSSYLQGYGQSLATVPAVLQFNKCDLPDALPAEELDRALNPGGLASYRASSHSGEGVLQAVMALAKTILTGLRAKGAEGIAGAEGLQRVVEAAPAPAAAAEPIPAAQAAAPKAVPAAPTPAPEPDEIAPAQAAAVPEVHAPQEAEELSLELAGPPRSAGGDRISVPLILRSGATTKTVTLTLSLSVEEG